MSGPGPATRTSEQVLLHIQKRSSPSREHSGCFKWQGFINSSGYGQIRWKGKTWSVHRLVYILQNLPFNTDLIICHTCDQPDCVNIDHLFAGTHADNMQDASRKGRLNRTKTMAHERLMETMI